MADQCVNCDYMRERTYGTSKVMECRVSEPFKAGLQSQLGSWPEVKGWDWCGEYDPLGWNDPANLIFNSIILNSITKTLVVRAPTSGYILMTTSANVTNTSANKGIMVKFFDGNTTTLIGAVSANAGQSEGRVFVIRVLSGEVWAQLDASDGSDVYVLVQGKQVMPQVQAHQVVPGTNAPDAGTPAY